MNYTTQQLKAMSDDMINFALYWSLYGGQCDSQIKPALPPNYCSEPNAIMPLAFERNVSIVQSEADRKHGQWCAFLWHTEDEFNDKNPLRAIACLLLIIETNPQPQ